jgi:EAL domain-containing protein (putative c-di-GMP-specific phosphodiesterase class I)
VSLEPEFVKLDMALIRGIDGSPIRQHIVRSIVDLCGKLQMQVVAEGVETAAEMRTVRLLGCHFAQGYFIGRPAEDFAPLSALKLGVTPAAIPRS